MSYYVICCIRSKYIMREVGGSRAAAFAPAADLPAAETAAAEPAAAEPAVADGAGTNDQ